jgi:hypothetical protein
MDQFKTDRPGYQLASRDSFVFNTIKSLPDRYTTKLNPTQLVENKRRRSRQIATKSRFLRRLHSGGLVHGPETGARCLDPGSPSQAHRIKPQHQNEQSSTQVTENKPGARRQAATQMHVLCYIYRRAVSKSRCDSPRVPKIGIDENSATGPKVKVPFFRPPWWTQPRTEWCRAKPGRARQGFSEVEPARRSFSEVEPARRSFSEVEPARRSFSEVGSTFNCQL